MGDDTSSKTRAVAPNVASMLGHLQPLFVEMQAKLAAQLQAQLQLWRPLSASSKKDPVVPDFTRPQFARGPSRCIIYKTSKRRHLYRLPTQTSCQHDNRFNTPLFPNHRPRRRPLSSHSHSGHSSGPKEISERR